MKLPKLLFLLVIPALALASCGTKEGAPAPAASPASTAVAPAASPAPAGGPAAPAEAEPPKPAAFRLPRMPKRPLEPKRGIKLTPPVIRRLVLSEDISVLQSLNNVYKAREEITRAHTSLLPSINISALVSSAGTFGLGGIGFLVPFLAPSNWYNLEIRKQQLAAHGYAFHLVQLNQYASAHSLYLAMLADEEILAQTEISYENIEQIRAFVELLVKEGKVTVDKLQQATAQAQLAHMQVIQLRNTIAMSRASLRRMLGFDLRREFHLEKTHLGPVRGEESSPVVMLRQVFERSPEARQVDSLLAAARSGKWSVPFAFIGSPGGSMSTEGGSVAFSGSGSVNLGFGVFPEVRLAELNVREYQLRRREIYLEMAKAIEQTLVSLANAKAELADVTSAEENANLAYQYAQKEFAQGKITLTDLIGANGLVIGTAISRIASRLKVDTQRVNLHRILISGEFAKIPTCRLDPGLVRDRPFGWLRSIFHRDRNRVSVDELCRGR